MSEAAVPHRERFIAVARLTADIAGVAILVMMVMTVVSSLGRLFFSMPILGK